MKSESLHPIDRGQRRGPFPGAAEKYGDSDRALFPDLERMMLEGKSLRAATIALVSANRVPGRGSARGRAERLAARFRKERLSAPL
jgi:hypothetical protein